MDISYLSADTIRRTSDLSYCFIFHQEAMEKRPEQTSIQVPNMLDCGHYSVSPAIVPSMITIPEARVDSCLFSIGIQPSMLPRILSYYYFTLQLRLA